MRILYKVLCTRMLLVVTLTWLCFVEVNTSQTLSGTQNTRGKLRRCGYLI